MTVIVIRRKQHTHPTVEEKLDFPYNLKIYSKPVLMLMVLLLLHLLNSTSFSKQNMELLKEPVSRNAYPRNLISKHHKCFLYFENFSISVGSRHFPVP